MKEMCRVPRVIDKTPQVQPVVRLSMWNISSQKRAASRAESPITRPNIDSHPKQLAQAVIGASLGLLLAGGTLDHF
jgi:hypothetical protein